MKVRADVNWSHPAAHSIPTGGCHCSAHVQGGCISRSYAADSCDAHELSATGGRHFTSRAAATHAHPRVRLKLAAQPSVTHTPDPSRLSPSQAVRSRCHSTNGLARACVHHGAYAYASMYVRLKSQSKCIQPTHHTHPSHHQHPHDHVQPRPRSAQSNQTPRKRVRAHTHMITQAHQPSCCSHALACMPSRCHTTTQPMTQH